MPALSLHEASKHNSGIVKQEAVVRTFEAQSHLLRMMPMMNLNGDTFSYNVQDKLPNIGYRGYNEGFQTSVGVINPQTERLALIGGDIDVDRRLVWTRGNIVRSEQEQDAVTAMAMKINAEMLNGDGETDPRRFDGLRKRITGNQLFPADISAPAANGPLSIFTLMTAIDSVVNPSAIICSPAMKRRLDVAARNDLGGDLNTTKDEFGYRISTYNDIPIIVMKFDNEGQWIIDQNEAGPAAGADSTSLYVVNFGNNGVRGLQNGGIVVDDLGELNAKPVYRTRIEWQVGMAVMHGRAAARIWGISDAPCVA